MLERAFWRLVSDGLSTESAAVATGVSVVQARRWFVKSGGMSPLSLAEPAGRYLSFVEREEITVLRAEGRTMWSIARELGRAPSTISRELDRNAPVDRPSR